MPKPYTTVQFRKHPADVAVQHALKFGVTHQTPHVDLKYDRYKIKVLHLAMKLWHSERGIEYQIPEDKFVDWICDLLVDAAADYQDKGKRCHKRLEKVIKPIMADKLQVSRYLGDLQPNKTPRAEG